MEHVLKQDTHVAHHFSDAEQQRDSAKLGMWIFLITEVLLFSGLFTAYAVYRAWHPETFINAHKFLNVGLGTLNTVVLITSSVTIALGIRSIQVNRRKQAIGLFIATLVLAAAFLVVKYFEYSHKTHLGQLPGKYYTFTGIEGTDPQVFFSVYFLLTGLHGLHIVFGMAAITWILIRTINNEFSPEYFTPAENVGLYWHLVDLIWIFLFPLLYLIG